MRVLIRAASAHGLRSLRIQSTSYRKFLLPRVLHAVPNSRTSTEAVVGTTKYSKLPHY